MRIKLILVSALCVLGAACDERILPPPLDGEGGAGGEEAAPAKPKEPDSEALSKGACQGNGVKCSGRW